MYNRYVNSGDFDEYFVPDNMQQEPVAEEPVPSEDEFKQKSSSKGLGALKGLFSGNGKLPEINADTILLLVLVYFLVADSDENMTDTLLIIGALLLLGF